MKPLEPMTHRVAVAVLIVASAFALRVAHAQQAGSKRTDLQRHDLSVPGREVVQVRVDFAPGYVAPRHTHPGEEIVYVIEGSLEYEIDGKLAKVKAGDVIYALPDGTGYIVGTDQLDEDSEYHLTRERGNREPLTITRERSPSCAAARMRPTGSRSRRAGSVRDSRAARSWS